MLSEPTKKYSNIVSILEERGRISPENTAFSFFERLDSTPMSVTFLELDRRARAVAARLQKGNIKGERALLIYPTSLDFISAFMGCLYSGIIAIPVWPPTEERSMNNLAHITEDASPAIVLTNAGMKTHSGLAEFRRIYKNRDNLQWIDTGGISDNLASEYRVEEIKEEDVAYLQYTSGSTSQPKGVRISHGNIVANSRLIESHYSSDLNTIGLSWLPHYHDMGLVGKILSPLYTGCHVVFTPPRTFIKRPLLWLRAISRFKATISSAPNYAYDICASLAEKVRVDPQLDLSSWKVAISGGEPVKAATLRRFAKAFSRYGFDPGAFCPSYGLAESTLLVSGIKHDEYPRIETFDAQSLLGTTVSPAFPGKPVKDMVSNGSLEDISGVKIVSPLSLNPCRENEVGEVWVDTPSVAQGFWNNGRVNGNTFHSRLPVSGAKKYLRTGDLGFINEGHLYITGRKKDLIIVGGRNYYPQDLESSAEESHVSLKKNSSAAFQCEISGKDEVVLIAEVKTLCKKEDYAEICSGIRKTLHRQHNISVDKIFLVKSGAIPKTASGKIQRFLCRKFFEQRTLKILNRPETGVEALNKDSLDQEMEKRPMPRELEKRILAKIIACTATERDAFRINQPLYDLGLSSLKAAELGIEIEEILGCEIYLGENIQDMTADQVLRVIGKQYAASEGKNNTDGNDSQPALSDSAPESKGIDVDSRFSAEYLNGNLFEVAQNFTLFDELRKSNQMPFFQPLDSNEGTTCVYRGKRAIMLGSNNYLGLSSDHRVREAASKAAIDYGPSMTGSRLLNGTSIRHEALEKKLADFLGYESALVFTTGYQANLGLLSALMNKGSYLLLDEDCHASIYDGAILSKCIMREFKHNDPADLEKKLAAIPDGSTRMVIVDGVYSMKGEIAPLPEIDRVCREWNIPYVVDEAHALGVLGATGTGTREHFNLTGKADLLTGTFSKSLASVGGWIAGDSKVIDWIRFYGRPMLFSASLPPSSVAAASTSLDILKEEPWRIKRVGENAAYFGKALLNAGFDLCDSVTPIIAIKINNDLLCVQFAKRLLDSGVFVNACVYPAVQKNAALIRTSVIATHEKDTLDESVKIMAEVARELKIIPDSLDNI